MGKPSAPSASSMANAQTASNRETAVAQAGLNMVNQTDAYGNKLEFSQNGKWADGTPKFSATQTLSAPQQQLLNTGVATQQNLANLAQEQSGRISGLLNQDLDWSAQQNYLNDLTRQNLDPQWNQMQEANEQELINRGLRPGSDAYNRAKDQFLQSRSSAYNNANLNNYNSALQSQLSLRQAPLNEILALSGQGQVATPSFAATPQTPVAGVDTAGITNNAFNQQMAGYNAGQQQLGGLFSAGASLIPLLSDERIKTNLNVIGKHPVGVDIYEYDRLDTGEHEIGVIAQHLEKIRPDLVDSTYEDGLKRVWYGKLNQEFPYVAN
jgi:hypothetical protein